MIQSARFNRANRWIQEKDHIRTNGPETFDGETYTSMLFMRLLKEQFKVSAKVSFDEEMAPAIVVAQQPTYLSGNCWEYREHFEVVLFNQGINLWHHVYVDDTPSWTKLRHWRLAVQSRKKYNLRVTCTEKDFTVELDELNLGSKELTLKLPVFAGITGCEGLNRFYEFKLHSI